VPIIVEGTVLVVVVVVVWWWVFFTITWRHSACIS